MLIGRVSSACHRFGIAMLAAAAWLSSACIGAAEPNIPHLWDSKERLTRPDLTELPRLRFLTTTDFPPFNFLDSAGRLSGFHVDLARAICKELALMNRCQIQALPWSELDGALERGEGEAIIAGISATADNRNKYAFSRPYLVFPARFVTLTNKEIAEPLSTKLNDSRVGVLAGSAHERMLRANFEGVRVVTYARQDWINADLKDGKLDAMFGDGMRLSFWLAGGEAAKCCKFSGGAYFSPDFLGGGLTIATRKDRDDLTAAFDYALQAISSRPEFGELYLRYFPVDFF
jgi:polar amino acid transport system substrate-binding protein